MWENIGLLTLGVALIGYAAWAIPWGLRRIRRDREARSMK
jgi:hypothetical protein